MISMDQAVFEELWYSFTLSVTPWSRYCCFPHFTEETKHRNVKSHSLLSGCAEFWTSTVWHQSLISKPLFNFSLHNRVSEALVASCFDETALV